MVWFFCLFVCLLVCLFLDFFFFFETEFPGCPGIHSVDQAGLKLGNLPASASQVLGLKACATTTPLTFIFYGEFLLGKKKISLLRELESYPLQHLLAQDLGSLRKVSE